MNIERINRKSDNIDVESVLEVIKPKINDYLTIDRKARKIFGLSNSIDLISYSKALDEYKIAEVEKFNKLDDIKIETYRFNLTSLKEMRVELLKYKYSCSFKFKIFIETSFYNNLNDIEEILKLFINDESDNIEIHLFIDNSFYLHNGGDDKIIDLCNKYYDIIMNQKTN